MKYTILKILDVSGFTFLSPVVRLCTGEEPQKQLREIAQFILVPAIAFAIFVVLWAAVAPRHKTKSGEVPTPAVTADAASSIWTFHRREGKKERAYRQAGESREKELAAAQLRFEKLKEEEVAAIEKVKEAEAAKAEKTVERLQPLEEERLARKSKFDEAATKRENELKAIAKKLPANDAKLRSGYLRKTARHIEQLETERDVLKSMRAKEDDIRAAKFPELVAARKRQTKIAEERQYLSKLIEQLSSNNRALKTETAEEKLLAQKKEYLSAQGPAALTMASSISKAEDRIETISGSEYAKPWTLPNQTIRSVACAFFGFFLGSAIAIPIGVLCGLSRTFMAAVTPFIALFKPVSPIVWLPIALIIVGGFIQDPDKHWFIQMLWDLPLIGWMKINPAFIASGVTVALCSLWPTLVNTALGVASIDEDHMNVAKVLKLGFWSRLFKIVIPSALPLIFAGLRISLGVGWMVLIAAELLASSEGIGKFVWDQFNNGASDSFAKMFVVVFVVGLIGFLLDRIMIVFQRMVSFDGAPAAL